MQHRIVNWECSRHFGLQGSLFLGDPEARREGFSPRIGGGLSVPTGKNWTVSPARRARAVRRARLAMMARRFARRVGLVIGLAGWGAAGIGGGANFVWAQVPDAAPAISSGVIAEPTQAAADPVEVAVEPVVVSETRTEKPLSQVTGSVHVITREQLEKRSFPYLRDVLRDVPGLTIIQTGSRGGTTSLFTRGGEADFTMVLIDGVKVNDAGGGFEFANLTTDNIERIEVVKGPQSALYGSDAIGGVINIITRKGSGPTRMVGEVMAGGGRGLGSSMLTHQERVGGTYQRSDGRSDRHQALVLLDPDWERGGWSLMHLPMPRAFMRFMSSSPAAR